MRFTTVFLDRDGVINRRLPGDYVKGPGELELLPGVVEAIASLGRAGVFTVVVTNQRGIGRGLFSVADLERVHAELRERLAAGGARIDHWEFCPDLEGRRRKPEPGMLLDAMRAFPRIEPGRSVMIGDSASDLVAAARAGVASILVGDGAELARTLAAAREQGAEPMACAASLLEAVRGVVLG